MLGSWLARRRERGRDTHTVPHSDLGACHLWKTERGLDRLTNYWWSANRWVAGPEALAAHYRGAPDLGHRVVVAGSHTSAPSLRLVPRADGVAGPKDGAKCHI